MQWLYLLSHFECDSHRVHMLTQQHPPPTLTSTVKLSLVTHVHSSPWLPGYMDVAPAVLIILTITGLLSGQMVVDMHKHINKHTV